MEKLDIKVIMTTKQVHNNPKKVVQDEKLKPKNDK